MPRFDGTTPVSEALVPRGIMFHHFHGDVHAPSQGSLDAQALDGAIRWLGRDRILDPHAWIEKLTRDALEPGDVCLTFDDSLRCQYDVALPVLEAHGVTAFWFVSSCVFEGGQTVFEIHRRFRSTSFACLDDFYTAFFDELAVCASDAHRASVLSEDELAARRAPAPFYSDADLRYRFVRDELLSVTSFDALMDRMMTRMGASVEALSRDLWMTDAHLAALTARGHHVGLHSYSHPMAFDRLSDREQADEYQRNFDHLRRTCGVVPVAMSHPVNRYTASTLRVLADLGIRCGFRATMSPPRGGSLNQTALEMAREDHVMLLRRVTEVSSARQ